MHFLCKKQHPSLAPSICSVKSLKRLSSKIKVLSIVNCPFRSKSPKVTFSHEGLSQIAKFGWSQSTFLLRLLSHPTFLRKSKASSLKTPRKVDSIFATRKRLTRWRRANHPIIHICVYIYRLCSSVRSVNLQKWHSFTLENSRIWQNKVTIRVNDSIHMGESFHPKQQFGVVKGNVTSLKFTQIDSNALAQVAITQAVYQPPSCQLPIFLSVYDITHVLSQPSIKMMIEIEPIW